LGWLADILQNRGKVKISHRQPSAEVGDGGGGVGQPFLDRQGRAALGLPRPAPPRECSAKKEVAGGQGGVEFERAGVVVGQLLLDRQSRAELSLRVRHLARVQDQEADARVRGRQSVAHLVRCVRGGGQHLLVSQRQLVDGQCIGRLSGQVQEIPQL